MVPFSWYVILSALVFMIGLVGVLTRRNLIIIFLSIELMLNGVNILLVASSHYLQAIQGQVLVFFVIMVAASEAAIGLALILLIWRNRATVSIDDLSLMRG
jgi:NADH-quinone oxidoreductase subunit K